MKKENVSVLLVILVLVVFGLLGGLGYIFFMKSSPASPPSKSGQLSETKLKGDINRDEKADAEDAELIRKASPCNQVDPCWSKVVGKTKDGDNPIYVSDLDLNNDDNVNELDISVMSSD